MSRWSWWCCYSGPGRSTTVSCWCLSTAPQHHYSTDYNPADKYTHSICVHTDVKLYFFICLHPGEVRENKHWTFPLTARKKNLQSAEQMVSKTKVMRDSSLLSLSAVIDWGSLWKQVCSELGDSLYIYMLLVWYPLRDMFVFTCIQEHWGWASGSLCPDPRGSCRHTRQPPPMLSSPIKKIYILTHFHAFSLAVQTLTTIQVDVNHSKRINIWPWKQQFD